MNIDVTPVNAPERLAAEVARTPRMGRVTLKRSVVLRGEKTSVSLEEPFWLSLREIAAKERLTLSNLVEMIDERREDANLSSAIRVFVLMHYQGVKLSPFSAPRP